jgi:RNA recognition motif-containing protein
LLKEHIKAAGFIVDGVDASVSADELKRLFSDYGTVLSVRMTTTLDGDPLGLAEIEMKSEQEVDKVIGSLNRCLFKGRMLLLYLMTEEQ